MSRSVSVLHGPPIEGPWGTCDWGGCDGVAVEWRWDDAHGWLPVCGDHVARRGAVDPTGVGKSAAVPTEQGSGLQRGEVERLREAIRLLLWYADNGWNMRAGHGEALAEARLLVPRALDEDHDG